MNKVVINVPEGQKIYCAMLFNSYRDDCCEESGDDVKIDCFYVFGKDYDDARSKIADILCSKFDEKEGLGVYINHNNRFDVVEDYKESLDHFYYEKGKKIYSYDEDLIIVQADFFEFKENNTSSQILINHDNNKIYTVYFNGGGSLPFIHYNILALNITDAKEKAINFIANETDDGKDSLNEMYNFEWFLAESDFSEIMEK